MMPVVVVVLLDAVKNGSRADHPTKTREGTKRVVVPLADTPQKRDGRPSPEQMNSMSGDVPEALLFHLVCAQETEREKLFRQRELLVFVIASKRTRRWS